MQANVFSGVSLNSFAIFGINLAISSSFVNSLKSTKILPFLSISSYKILKYENNNCFSELIITEHSTTYFARAYIYMVINTVSFGAKHGSIILNILTYYLCLLTTLVLDINTIILN